MSFAGLRDLALACGYSGRTAWLLPVAVDALALAAWQVWLTTGRPFAWRCGLAATIASLLGNGTAHYLAGDGRWLLTAVVGAVPALIVPAVMHLTAPVEGEAACEAPRETYAADVWPEPTPDRPPVPHAALTSATTEADDARWAAANGIALDLVARARAADCATKPYRAIKGTLPGITEDEARAIGRVFARKGPPPAAARARQAVTA